MWYKVSVKNKLKEVKKSKIDKIYNKCKIK